MSKKREQAYKLQANLRKKGKNLLDVNPSLAQHLGCPNGKKCGLCRHGTFDQDPVKVDRREAKIRIKNEIRD